MPNSLWHNPPPPPWTVACQAPLFMEFSKQEYSVHGILQARILEWRAIPFSRELNLGLLHYRRTLYFLNHQGKDLKHIIIFSCQDIPYPLAKLNLSLKKKKKLKQKIKWLLFSQQSAAQQEVDPKNTMLLKTSLRLSWKQNESCCIQ